VLDAYLVLEPVIPTPRCLANASPGKMGKGVELGQVRRPPTQHDLHRLALGSSKVSLPTHLKGLVLEHDLARVTA
jgi:hypothetical protein